MVCVTGCAAVGTATVLAVPHRSVPAARRAVPRRRSTAVVESSRRLSCQLRRPRFRTLPAVRPTGFCLALRRGAARSDEDVLVTPRPDPRKNPGEQFALMLLSSDGKLLWYEQRPTKVHDFKVLRFRGRPALAFFQQDGSHGYYQLLDEHYRPLQRVTAGHGYSTNLHELQPDADAGDSAWVSADVRVATRASGTVIEYVVQKVDIASGRVLFEWHSLAHVAPRESYEQRPAHGAWDYFHGNSIAPPTTKDPTVIVSSRNTSSLYGVDPASGQTRWILGGKRDQFHLPRRWQFCAQHDAHRLANGDIMLFDNGGADMHGTPRCPAHPARALVFRLDVSHRRVRLVRSLPSQPVSRDGRGFLSSFVGSARPRADGGTIVDWGQIPRVSLFGRGGREDAMLRLQ
ncbi:MAG: Arylsulfotransferase, partial [Solirubrobacterales bacterium]|nr:Arylsulfotransferase [Solirubrobacterales bacterium]